MGLVALALEHTSAFPTFPRRMSPSEISAGLVLPYAAEAILGKAGAAAVLVLMFLSCESAFSPLIRFLRELTLRISYHRHKRYLLSAYGSVNCTFLRCLQDLHSTSSVGRSTTESFALIRDRLLHFYGCFRFCSTWRRCGSR